MRAKYCKCLNTYTISNCDCENIPKYWQQGIGALVGKNDRVIAQNTFDNTFDNTFN